MASKDSIFGSKSKTFAQISSDNRLHLWDVETRKERKGHVDKNHLSHQFTCYNWRQGKKDKLGEFVVGFSDGIIVVWDLTRGVISKTIGSVNETPSPTSIVFANDLNSIFVSSNQSTVIQYNITTGEVERTIKAHKKGTLKLAVNPKANVIAAASSSIRLIDVETQRVRKLEANLSGGVAALVFSTCGRYLAAASGKSRELLIFDVTLDSDVLEPVQVVTLNGIVSAIDTKTWKSQHAVEFLVLYEEGNGCVFRFSTNYAENKENGVDSLLSMTHINSNNAEIISGFIGNLSGESDGKGVVLAVGQKSHPLFVHVETVDNEGRALETVQVNDKQQAASASAEVSTSNGKSVSVLADPEVLGPKEMGGVKRPLIDSVEPASSSSSKKSKKGENGSLLDSATPAEEMTLEQRLESMSRAMQVLEDAADSEPALPASLAAQAPTTDSLVTLIDQALQSGDDSLLEQCLICGDNDIVEATARRLPTGRIVLFLRKLVAKFEKRPSRGLLLTRWLASILRYHTSYLITVPDLSFQLAGLSQMLEQRLSSYTRLSSLAGRLDLLLSQVSYQDGGSEGQSNGRLAKITPQQVYQEK